MSLLGRFLKHVARDSCGSHEQLCRFEIVTLTTVYHHFDGFVLALTARSNEQLIATPRQADIKFPYFLGDVARESTKTLRLFPA